MTTESNTLLHEPIRIGGATIRNRLYRAPVLEGAGDGDDAAEAYARHFVENARHGVGLVVQGSSCIWAEGRTSPGMTCVDTREKAMRLAPMVDAVHAEGAAIFVQLGHGGLYAMEAWHEPYASARRGPVLAAAPVPWPLRPGFRGVPVHVMTTAEVHAMAERYGEVSAWLREAGYDGVQLGSANAKLLDQFLSPFYNHRTDEFGGSLEARARVLRLIRAAVARRAGPDFPCTVKVPAETAPPGFPRSTLDDALRLARLVEEWGFDAITPVRGLGLPRHDSVSRWCARFVLDEPRDGDAARPRRADPHASRHHQGWSLVGWADRPLPVGVEPRPVRRRAPRSRHPRPRGRRDPHRVGGAADPRARRGRPGRHRPSLLRGTRPRGAHPRPRRRARTLPELEPVRPRPDARDEGRVLQPRRPPLVVMLDNPMWHALQGPDGRFARTEGRAARYDPEVTPFAGMADDPDAAAWADLAALYGPDEVAVLTARRPLEPPDSWETVGRIPGVQMVGPTTVEPGEGPGWIGAPLGLDDVADMLALVGRTEPGPFLPRTVELGGYLGVRRDGHLVAMAGHRMHLPGFTEISAVCTDVEVRGQGIAGSLVGQLVAGIVARGEQPFLHATVSNVNAIRLYEALGFRVRTRLEFLAVRRPADPHGSTDL